MTCLSADLYFILLSAVIKFIYSIIELNLIKRPGVFGGAVPHMNVEVWKFLDSKMHHDESVNDSASTE